MSADKKTEVVLALDVDSLERAEGILAAIGDDLRWVKIGLQAYLRDGPDFVHRVAEGGRKVFLDLKLLDIPNTMAKALESLADLPISMLTLHASAGTEALRRCAEVASERLPDVRLLGVTVLTSMDETALRNLGVGRSVEEQVEHLATMAELAGLGGVVCSPWEIKPLRRILSPATVLVTPGIRPSGIEKGDQRRIMTPGEAAGAGADFLVIGRPILMATDPATALASIRSELSSAS